MNLQVAAPAGDGEIDVRALVVTLWSRRWWIVAAVLLFAVAFGALAFLMTPVYRATTTVVAVNNDMSGMGQLGSALGQLGGLASLAGINLGSTGSETEETLAVLRSREFTEGFIRDHNLMPTLFPDRWDEKSQRWRGEEADWPTLAQAFQFFDSEVRLISRDRKTNLITVQIEWRDRKKAALWANELVARLNSEMRARAIQRTTASMKYLEKELAATSTLETRQAINRLIEAQINQRMLANVTEEYALRVVDRALPSDPRDVAKPRKPMLIALGMVIGLLFGVVGVLTFSALESLRRS